MRIQMSTEQLAMKYTTRSAAILLHSLPLEHASFDSTRLHHATLSANTILPTSAFLAAAIHRHRLQNRQPATCASVLWSSQLASLQCVRITLRYITSDTQNILDMDHNNDQSNNCSSHTAARAYSSSPQQQLAFTTARFQLTAAISSCSSVHRRSTLYINIKTTPTN